ncbi:DinB family protein [Actinomycetospora corticicola]|uniref:Putative damage-inducible protein DinB n=1 Tax=Actinomycetospora corticicola TaxID=663602 RepID=A0A7Y9DU02_9PSEU|nr:DinB family protein [Actinomycetospora corticicola]NYD35506.1 putative damage-inducible protein DinB [Actinomycetospora corticicola]
MAGFVLGDRPDPPIAAPEADTLVGFLEFQRATFAWKCGGLDGAGLATRVGVSTMTLGGLLGHLTAVEDSWFTDDFAGRSVATADDPWAATAAPDVLRSQWRAAVDRSRAVVAEALREQGLDAVARDPKPPERPVTLRWILVHMIEEYARHNGHADLLREAVDGETGE